MNKYLVLIFIIITLSIIIYCIPSTTKYENINFDVVDQKGNLFYEENSKLLFVINDTSNLVSKDVVWYFGTNDTLVGYNNIEYTYNKPGKYLITLKFDNNHYIDRVIDVISNKDSKPNDSLGIIYGPSRGYTNEELFFSARGEGNSSYQWEFGESKTIDSYDQQVVYSYDKPGVYFISLKTNNMLYKTSKRVEILSPFKKEEIVIDSLDYVGEDIRKHLQAIANASAYQSNVYTENFNYIKNKYLCMDPKKVLVDINGGTSYNYFSDYCQGLHFFESNKKRIVSIDKVVVDSIRCIPRINVFQSYPETK